MGLISNFGRDLGLRQIGRWATMTVLIGAVAAAGAIVFDQVQLAVEEKFLIGWANFVPPGHHEVPPDQVEPVAEYHTIPMLLDRQEIVWWAIILVPMLGGLISGALVFLLAPEAEGHGTDAVIRSYHREWGKIRWHVPLVKLLASAITIGSGGSAGREGPIAQIGAGFGSWLGTLLRLSEREKRTLVLAGVAAGIGAMFRAPLGGAFFAAEVLYRRLEFEAESLIPGMMASILSYSLFCVYSGTGFTEIFSIPNGMEFNNPLELGLYAVVAIFLALLGAVYVHVFYFVKERVFRPMPIPALLKPMIGGGLVGGIAVFFPAILGVSYGYLLGPLWATTPSSWEEIQGPVLFFLSLGLLKILATSITIGSGGSGGVFAPSLVIGGSFGAVFGLVFAYLFPGVVSQPGTYVLVGMGAFFSGVAKVPFASLIMVCELTSGYGLLVPLMLATAVTYVFTQQKVSIYREQVAGRIDSPAHRDEFMVDILQQVQVREVMIPFPEPLAIPDDTLLGEVLKRSTQVAHQVFVVTNEDHEAVGVISLDDVRSYYYQSEMGNLVIAGDIARPLETLSPDDDLNTALQRLVLADFEEYPIVEEKEPGRVIGLVSRRDVLKAYNQRLKDRPEVSDTPFL
jgi:CIC family chloride channel protein